MSTFCDWNNNYNAFYDLERKIQINKADLPKKYLLNFC